MSSEKTIKEIFSDNRIQHFVTSEKFKFNIPRPTAYRLTV